MATAEHGPMGPDDNDINAERLDTEQQDRRESAETSGAELGEHTLAWLTRTRVALAPDLDLEVDLVTDELRLIAAGDDAEADAADEALRAAARLARLHWTWRRTPVPTPGALWGLQAAELAAQCGFPGPVAEARSGLARALSDMERGAWRLPADVARAASRCRAHLADDRPGLPETPLLQDLCTGMRALAATRVRTHPSPGVPGPADPLTQRHDRFELEWDRVPPFQLDPREAACHADLVPGGVRVVVGAMASRSWLPVAQVWARVISAGTVLGVAELHGSDRSYLGVVPVPDEPPSSWFVDVVADPDITPRSRSGRQLAWAEQALFRALLLDRASNSRPELRQWRTNLWDRYTRMAGIGARLATPPAGDSGAGLFLAEELVEPSAVALLSPRAPSPTP